MTAHSRGLGHGSEFTVQLPIVAADGRAASASPISSSVPTVSRRARRVLIVDDNGRCRITCLLVRINGHDTLQGSRWLWRRLEAVERLRPDVVLLDIGLPSLNGYEVCRHIRSSPGGSTWYSWL